MKRINVLFVIPTLTFGGAERIIVTLLNHLDRSRFRLSIAVIDVRKEIYLKEIPLDVEFIDIGSTSTRKGLFKILSLIWKMQPDVVFSTLSHLNLALSIIRPLLPSAIHFIARETSIISVNVKGYRYPRLWLLMYRLFYKRLDLIICQSYAMQIDLLNTCGLPKRQTLVINNPVNIDHVKKMAIITPPRPNRDDKRIHFVAAGRLSSEKGFDILISAIAILKNPKIHLSILGDGPLLAELKELAEIKGVSSNIEFVGVQSNPYTWFADANAFILSSRYEGFPNVVLEALACGTPVIATAALGGVKEILEPIPCCVIAEGVSATALAKAIIKWMQHPESKVPTSAVEIYALDHIVGKYENAIENCEAK